MSKNAPNINENIFESTECLSHIQLLSYAGDNLSSVEKHKIEKHLIDCPLCSDAVDGLLKRTNINETEEIIDNLNIEISKKLINKRSTSSWKRHIYSIAAALLIGVGYLYFNQFILNDSHNLFNTYFEAYPNTVPIFRGDTITNDLQSAMIEYEKNNHENALFYLEKLLTNNPDHPEANFYSGIIYLCLENPSKAISFLKHKQELDTEKLANETFWYLGLAYILNENITLAEIQFRHLNQTKNKYTEKTKKIIQKLEKM